MQNYTGSCVQRRSSLNVKAADVEQRQIREYDIATSHVVGGSTVDGVEHESLLGQNRSLGPAGCA